MAVINKLMYPSSWEKQPRDKKQLGNYYGNLTHGETIQNSTDNLKIKQPGSLANDVRWPFPTTITHGDTLGREPAPKNPNAHLGGWHNIPKDIVRIDESQPTTKNPFSISSQDLKSKGLVGLNPNAGFKKEVPKTVQDDFSSSQAKDAYTNWQTQWNTLSGMTGSKWDPEEITFMGKHIDWAATKGSKDKKQQQYETDKAWANYLNLAGIDPHSKTGKQPDPWQKSQSNPEPKYGNFQFGERPGATKMGVAQHYLKQTIGSGWKDVLNQLKRQNNLRSNSPEYFSAVEDIINKGADSQYSNLWSKEQETVQDDFGWYDFSEVDAARDKNYDAQEQLELLPKNEKPKDPWHTIDSHWASLDASNPLPQGSARDFDRRDTSTWSDWMKSQPYSGFKNYWDYDRAESAYTKKQSGAGEMYFDQDAGEWYLKTPDKYHSYNPGGSNYDPRFSQSFEQAKADKGWTSFVPQDHRSWKRGDDPLTPIPDYLSEGGEDLAFLNWGKKEPPDPSKKLPHGARTNILNYINSGGSIGNIPEGWTEEDVEEYIRNEQEGFQSRSALKGTEIANISGTPGKTSPDNWEENYLSMYGRQHPLIAGTGLSNLGMYIGSPSTGLPPAPDGTKTKRNPTKFIPTLTEYLVKRGMKSAYDKLDKTPYIHQRMANQFQGVFDQLNAVDANQWSFKPGTFDVSSQSNARFFNELQRSYSREIKEQIEKEKPGFIEEAYATSPIGIAQKEGQTVKQLKEAMKILFGSPEYRKNYFIKK